MRRRRRTPVRRRRGRPACRPAARRPSAPTATATSSRRGRPGVGDQVGDHRRRLARRAPGAAGRRRSSRCSGRAAAGGRRSASRSTQHAELRARGVPSRSSANRSSATRSSTSIRPPSASGSCVAGRRVDEHARGSARPGRRRRERDDQAVPARAPTGRARRARSRAGDAAGVACRPGAPPTPRCARRRRWPPSRPATAPSGDQCTASDRVVGRTGSTAAGGVGPSERPAPTAPGVPRRSLTKATRRPSGVSVGAQQPQASTSSRPASATASRRESVGRSASLSGCPSSAATSRAAPAATARWSRAWCASSFGSASIALDGVRPEQARAPGGRVGQRVAHPVEVRALELADRRHREVALGPVDHRVGDDAAAGRA